MLLVEEYEALRLIDLEKRTHDQCARQMQISRTTVTEIYEKARFKIADAIVNGKPLTINGGNYQICQESDCCACPGRGRRTVGLQSCAQGIQGVSHMKVAVPFKNDNIFQHFGMAPVFKVYVIENQTVASTELLPTGGHGHGAMVNLLVKNGVNCVVCGGLGGGAVRALEQAGIQLFAGNNGSADEAVNLLIAGELTNNIEAATAGRGGRCHGHGHSHGEEGCGCHGHGHGEEGCGCHGHGHGEEGCGCHGHGHGEEGCGCHGHGRSEEGCGCHGHDHGEEGCGCHGHGHGEEGCGCHGHGRKGHCGCGRH